MKNRTRWFASLLLTISGTALAADLATNPSARAPAPGPISAPVLASLHAQLETLTSLPSFEPNALASRLVELARPQGQASSPVAAASAILIGKALLNDDSYLAGRLKLHQDPSSALLMRSLGELRSKIRDAAPEERHAALATLLPLENELSQTHSVTPEALATMFDGAGPANSGGPAVRAEAGPGGAKIQLTLKPATSRERAEERPAVERRVLGQTPAGDGIDSPILLPQDQYPLYYLKSNAIGTITVGPAKTVSNRLGTFAVFSSASLMNLRKRRGTSLAITLQDSQGQARRVLLNPDRSYYLRVADLSQKKWEISTDVLGRKKAASVRIKDGETMFVDIVRPSLSVRIRTNPLIAAVAGGGLAAGLAFLLAGPAAMPWIVLGGLVGAGLVIAALGLKLIVGLMEWRVNNTEFALLGTLGLYIILFGLALAFLPVLARLFAR